MTTRPMLAALAAAALSTAATAAMAGEGETNAFIVRSLATVAVPTLGHLQGNLEITGNFVLPANVHCDAVYITTTRAQDPDRKMFAILKFSAQWKKPVRLRISDEATKAAFPGRCFIVAAGYPAATSVPPTFPDEPPEVSPPCHARPYLPVCLAR